MAYQMAATAMTLNDLEGYSPVAGLFKCSPSNVCATFYTISTDSVLARFLCISRASCSSKFHVGLAFHLSFESCGVFVVCAIFAVLCLLNHLCQVS